MRAGNCLSTDEPAGRVVTQSCGGWVQALTGVPQPPTVTTQCL